MPFGVTPQGFVPKTTEDILEDLRTRQEEAFGTTFLARIVTSVVGLLNAIFAAMLGDVWQLAMNVYRSSYPDTAEGVCLDYVAQIHGAQRVRAAKSTVTIRFVGTTSGTVVPVGTVVSHNVTGVRFVTTASGATAYNGILGIYFVSLAAESEDYGPIEASAATLTVIETPVSGINTCTNIADAELGALEETDEEFRIRRVEELRRQGASVASAIRSDLLQVPGVTAAKVFLNKTDATNSDGLPPHSFEAVVLGGEADDVRQCILESEPAGIQSYGTTSGTVVDSEGVNQTVRFSYADEEPVYVDIEVVTDSLTYDGDDALKAAIAEVGDELAVQAFIRANNGNNENDFIYNKLFAAAYGVAGVKEVTTLEIGLSPSPSGTSNIVLTARQLATFDTSRVTVL